MSEKSITVITIDSYQDMKQLEEIADSEQKAVILDVSKSSDRESLSEDAKREIAAVLKKVECVLVVFCRADDSFILAECRPYVDMVYLALESNDIAGIEERVHELVDERDLDQLKQLKQLFSRLRDKEGYEREEMKLEESRLFCKLACKKD